jgi:thiosulfate/3-mercaptopyruvate sulfurtransferase
VAHTAASTARVTFGVIRPPGRPAGADTVKRMADRIPPPSAPRPPSTPRPPAAPEPPALPGLFVSTAWLAEHLGQSGLVLLDATVVQRKSGGYLSGLDEYLIGGHLPGAVFADLVESFSAPDGAYPLTRPTATDFAAAAGEHGVGPGTAVVVYDGGLGEWAARLAWLLLAFGHDRVAALDGGLTKWRAEGRPIESGYVAPVPASFEARERPGFWADRPEVEAALSDGSTLLSAQPARAFAGDPQGRPRGGHLPGSLGVPMVRLLDRATSALLPEPDLRRVLSPALGDARVVSYCASGAAAAFDALVLRDLGAADVRVYDAGLAEWSTDPALPLTTEDPATPAPQPGDAPHES